MKKLRLEVDQVRVESFETVNPDRTLLEGEMLVTWTVRCGSCPAVSCAPCP